jgi:hypothetical protein
MNNQNEMDKKLTQLREAVAATSSLNLRAVKMEKVRYTIPGIVEGCEGKN